MNDDEMQEQFEREAEGLCYRIERDGNGEYCSPATAENWIFWKAACASKGAETKEEILRLRAVYEAARRVLRFNGVDRQKVNEAVDQLDDAIERVKLLDSGLED